MPGRVQAEGWPPRAPARLRAGARPALPEPPPPRALHAGEHPGHDDHSQRALLAAANGRRRRSAAAVCIYVRTRARTRTRRAASREPTPHLAAGAFPGGGSSRGRGSQACAGHFGQPPRVGLHHLVGPPRAFRPVWGSTATGRGEAVMPMVGWRWLWLQGKGSPPRAFNSCPRLVLASDGRARGQLPRHDMGCRGGGWESWPGECGGGPCARDGEEIHWPEELLGSDHIGSCHGHSKCDVM